jgi:hypothetical protein
MRAPKALSRVGIWTRRLWLLTAASTISLCTVAVPAASATVTVTSHFIWTATSSNTIAGFATEINNAATNGNPNAILFVTPVYDSGGVCGCVTMTDPIGVYYLGGDGKWGIIDSVISPGNIPPGTEFNVLVVQKPSSSVFIAKASTKNISGNGFLLHQTSTVGQPAALLQVTQNYTPDGQQVPSTNGHAPGVVYGLGANGNEWAIQNVDNASMPVGAAYNVMVGSAASNGGKAKLLTGTTSNTVGPLIKISNGETNGNPNAVVFETQNADPNLNFGFVDPNPTGVGYATSPDDYEYVFNENGNLMPTSPSYFNLLVFPS